MGRAFCSASLSKLTENPDMCISFNATDSSPQGPWAEWTEGGEVRALTVAF